MRNQSTGGICILALKNTFLLNLMKGLKAFFWILIEATSGIYTYFVFFIQFLQTFFKYLIHES